jgi:MFS family permease
MTGKSYKWVILALLSLAFFFHQADRVLFGLLTIPIQEELHLTDLQIGWINTSLFATLAIMVPIAGFLGDRVSRKWIITVSLMFWSLMTACTGFVGGMCGLIFFRSIATGGGESFYAPSAYALLATHHKETRSVAMAVHQAALYIGLMFSGALVAWVLSTLHSAEWVVSLFGEKGCWRPVFMIFGGIGFVLGVVFIWALREGAGKPAAAEESAGKPGCPFKDSLKAFFCCPSVLLNVIGFVAIVFANNAYLSWAPKFAARKFGLTVGEAGNGTMLYHHLCAFAAVMLAGLITDVMVRRGNPRFRLLLQMTAMLCGAPALVFFGLAPTTASAIGATMAYGVFRGLYEANTQSSMFDVVRPEHRSSVIGLANMVAFLVGSLSPLMIGALSDGIGMRGFEVGFALLGGSYLLGAIAMGAAFFFTFKKDRVSE